ncbi:branched-chain amino acid ABC transporter permease [Dactylosporangium sp. CA-092794]|uniref:branched-chain amino acid ABC transporter permease n=1 Tax=Dactylosporangium sp. CA-092794 TaxID=3239929 RepID=UPI003D8D7B33
MRLRITTTPAAVRALRWLSYVALATLVVVLAAEVPDYRLVSLCQVAAMAVAAMGLNFVSGFCGQISVGHGAFYGVGAYTTAVLVTRYDWPFLAALPVSGVVGLLAGLLVGIPALRVRGFYLALVTLALTVTFPTLANLDQLSRFTGGPNGLPVYVLADPPSWYPLAATPAGWKFLELSAVAAVMFVLAGNMLRSRVGRALVAVRDQETAAAASGVNTAAWKIGAFAVSAGYAAVGGGMILLAVPVVTPDLGGFTTSVSILAALVIGGTATRWGPLFGAFLVIWLPVLATDWGSDLPLLNDRTEPLVAVAFYGALLAVVVLVMPGGIADGLRRLTANFVRARPPAHSAHGPKSEVPPLAANAASNTVPKG